MPSLNGDFSEIKLLRNDWLLKSKHTKPYSAVAHPIKRITFSELLDCLRCSIDVLRADN